MAEERQQHNEILLHLQITRLFAKAFCMFIYAKILIYLEKYVSLNFQ